MPENYEYDVFFSYKRHPLTRNWTKKVRDLFEYWLTQELGKPDVRMFFDEDSIETGQPWPTVLSEALKHSRCMVCVWSPLYFQSSWCLTEWRSFLERERLSKLPKYGLIAPMRFHDGERYPEEAKNTQSVDITQYATTLPGFWDTSRAIELEERLKEFSIDVARMIVEAPAFQRGWPIVPTTPQAPVPQIVLERL
jgi:hypothetical protein